MSFTLRLILTLSLASLLSVPASADTPRPRIVDSIHGGLIAHDIGGDAEDGFDATIEFRFTPLFGEDWPIRILPTLGTDISLNGQTSAAYFGATAQYPLAGSVFVEAFLGFTLHDAETPTQRDGADLGCSLLFRQGLGIGYRQGAHALTLFGSHSSHGRILCDDDNNDGLTSLGLRYGYHF